MEGEAFGELCTWLKSVESSLRNKMFPFDDLNSNPQPVSQIDRLVLQEDNEKNTSITKAGHFIKHIQGR